MNKTTLVSAVVSALLLAACSDSNNDDNGSGSNGNNPNGFSAELRLKQFDNSEEFYAALRAGLVQQHSGRHSGSGEVTGEPVALPSVDENTSESADAGASDGGDAGGADSSFVDADASTQTTSDGAEVTQTNVQEIGVDEQDRVKSDGEYLFILNNEYGNNFDMDTDVPGEGPEIEPAVVSVVVPVDEEPVGDVPPEESDAATSVVDPGGFKTTVRILSMQNDVPDTTPVTDLEVDLGGAIASGMYLYKSGDQRNLVLTSVGFNNHLENWNDSEAFIGERSVVTKLNVSTPSQPTVEKSFAIDGQIISSRRIGNRLFMASRYYPVVQGVDRSQLTPEQYEDAVAMADLSESLPQFNQLDGSESQDLIDPKGCFVARKPEQDEYYSPDIVTLSVVNLDTLELADSECFLGSSETLYATTNAVYLATTRWDYSGIPILEEEDSVSATTFEDPREDTDIHQFTINDSGIIYTGSGVVKGHLGWNPLRKPFRMSEHNGYLRVATYSNFQNDSVSPIKVTVLKADGNSDLVTVAELPNDNRPAHIGKPGEQLYASRFLGNRGYLVTFRQTDPLYVVDFANPEDPMLAGELEIDGYSDYLQPIGENYLLGIGKDAVPAPDGFGDGFGALAQGVKLSLFNVSDPGNPTEVQSLVVGERGTEAVALQNHRAITVLPGNDSRATRVAFGIDVAGLAEPRPVTDPTLWYQWNFTGLHGFEIQTGDGAGIVKQGVMTVNSASNPIGSRYGYYGDDRSVMVGDSVYYIYGSTVYAANWQDLSNFSGPR